MVALLGWVSFALVLLQLIVSASFPASPPQAPASQNPDQGRNPLGSAPPGNQVLEMMLCKMVRLESPGKPVRRRQHLLSEPHARGRCSVAVPRSQTLAPRFSGCCFFFHSDLKMLRSPFRARLLFSYEPWPETATVGAEGRRGEESRTRSHCSVQLSALSRYVKGSVSLLWGYVNEEFK